MHPSIHPSIHPYIHTYTHRQTYRQTYHTIPFHTIPYHTITIPYHTYHTYISYIPYIQYNTIEYNTVQYNTIQYRHTYIHIYMYIYLSIYIYASSYIGFPLSFKHTHRVTILTIYSQHFFLFYPKRLGAKPSLKAAKQGESSAANPDECRSGRAWKATSPSLPPDGI